VPNKTPSHDQPGLIFGTLDATAFQKCFIAWTQALSGAIQGVIAVDGKTPRRSFDRPEGVPGTGRVNGRFRMEPKATHREVRRADTRQGLAADAALDLQ